MKTTLLKTTAITMCLYIAMAVNTSKTFAQGTLQFNQVINQIVNNSGTNYTVPAGKVFKVEAANAPGGGYLYFGSIYIYSSSSAFIGQFGSGSAGNWPFPIWLKAGDQVYTTNRSMGISGIEFNIVP